MTAIVGLVDDGRVYIGGDSACVAGYSITVRADAKVFRTGPYVFGFTTSFRMGQLLRHAFDPPAPTLNLDKFMATTWIDAVRTCLKDGGWAKKDSEQETGGLVYDPFAGSGTTLIAAHQIRARAAVVELDPRYVDVICRRWQEFTGEKPVRAATGSPVDFTSSSAT